jgi:hypothetical protein
MILAGTSVCTRTESRHRNDTLFSARVKDGSRTATRKGKRWMTPHENMRETQQFVCSCDAANLFDVSARTGRVRADIAEDVSRDWAAHERAGARREPECSCCSRCPRVGARHWTCNTGLRSDLLRRSACIALVGHWRRSNLPGRCVVRLGRAQYVGTRGVFGGCTNFWPAQSRVHRRRSVFERVNGPTGEQYFGRAPPIRGAAAVLWKGGTLPMPEHGARLTSRRSAGSKLPGVRVFCAPARACPRDRNVCVSANCRGPLHRSRARRRRCVL